MNMPLVILNRRRRGFTAFSPSTLFALAEPGVWFDPSDLTTLFQDPAGTTPVTAPGNTVGLMLDKSKALALGAELVTNGGWVLSGGASVSGGQLIFADGVYSDAYQTPAARVVGNTYVYEFDLTITSGTVVVRPDMSSTTGQQAFTTSGRKRFLAVAAGTRFGALTSAGVGVRIDNISVRELAGNHATQATLAARPTYSIEPVGGRRNLLLQTEAPTNAAWVTSGTSTVTSGITDPDGGSTAFTVKNTGAGGAARYQVVTVISGQTYTNSLWLRRRLGTGTVAILAINGQGGAGQAVTLTSAWQRFVAPAGFTNVASSTTGYMGFEIGTAGDEIDIWHPQLELGSTATAYQRVTTQHDVTEAGVASVGYLYFDGVNDAMATSTITPGTDKAQVFTGVRKVGGGVIAETGTNSFVVNGSIGLFAGGAISAGDGEYSILGTGTLGYGEDYAAPLSPITNVLTAQWDIAETPIDDQLILRVNGAVASVTNTGGAGLGTGNFLAYPLYIGARGGTTIPFTGHLYSLITRFGPTLDAATITSTEIWVAGKTGIVI